MLIFAKISAVFPLMLIFAEVSVIFPVMLIFAEVSVVFLALRLLNFFFFYFVRILN